MEKIVKETHFFINTELGYHLPVIQLVIHLGIDSGLSHKNQD